MRADIASARLIASDLLGRAGGTSDDGLAAPGAPCRVDHRLAGWRPARGAGACRGRPPAVRRGPAPRAHGVLPGIPQMASFRGSMICRSAALSKPPGSRASLGHRIDPRHEPWTPSCGRVRRFSVDHGHTSPVGVRSMVARDAHAGSGGERGRSSPISRRISANSVLGTATSAIWKAT